MKGFRDWLAGEREKLAPMTWGERGSYLWMYYKLYFLALAVLLLVGGTTVVHLATTPADNWFFAAMVNTTTDLGQGSDFYQGFAQYAGYDLKEKNLLIEDSIYCQPGEQTMGSTYYELLVSYLDSGTLDVAVMGQEDLVALGETGRLMDLENERTQALAAAYPDRLVYCTSQEGEEIPVGIDLSDTPLGREAYGGDCVLGVSAQPAHPDQVAVFLAYLLEEEHS